MSTYDPSGSFFTHLPRGCTLCRQGAKMVLFVTGLCHKDCFYCPISEQRKKKDVVFANERIVLSDEDILEEARNMNALGTGITGGEPLLVPRRVLHYIRLLKDAFGNSHHIHLYTATSASRDLLEHLKGAGLDEIRFHPPPGEWDRIGESGFSRSIELAKAIGLAAGLEIPSMPGSEHIAKFAREQGVFLNLNELEFSHTNTEAMKEYGFVICDDEGCSARGSREVALDIISDKDMVHFCTSRFKDANQLRMRLKRTAENTARQFDEITPDGTLFYGVIQGDIEMIRDILDQLDVPDKMYAACDGKVELGWWILQDIASQLGRDFDLWYEECYPTSTRMVVERIPVDTVGEM